MADCSTKVPKDLFKNVKFYLVEEGNDKVKDLLKQGGATREFFFSKLATHVVTSTTNFPEYQQVKDSGTPMVKPQWVIYSVKCEAIMPTSAFSIEEKLFSNVVACPSQIPPDDRDALWAMVTFYGGRCQTTFDATCTHLLVPKPDGEKYECALQNAEKVKIVIPEWILDCIKANKLLDESKYAPIAGPDTQSQSILTPDNQGQTTGAVVSDNVENISETPSSLLSPESPALSKLKKGEKNGSEKSSTKTSNEKHNLANDNKTTEVSNEGIKTRPGRHAAETAKKALKDLVKEGAVDGLDPKDDNCDDLSDMDEMKENNNGNKRKDRKGMKEKETGSESQKTSPTRFNREIIISKLLSGCVFFIEDYQYTVSYTVLNTWKKVIRQHAGDVVDSYSDKVTHVMCSHQHGDHFRKGLTDGKRMVTCHWLNDVIVEKKLRQPQTALHLPVPFKDKVLRCRNMIIAVSGFEGKQREILKDMIYLIGAKYTTYLSRSGTHLVSRTETSEKYKKASEWGIPIVNARWLCDIMSGGCDYPVNMKRYLTFGSGNELDINIILARELLEAWKDFEEKEDIMDKKRKLEMLEREMQEYEEAKRARLEQPTNPPESMASAGPATVRVLFTGLNIGSVRRLTEKLTALGGDTATSIRTCTHIVASKVLQLSPPHFFGSNVGSMRDGHYWISEENSLELIELSSINKIMRTIKFLTGISVCRYIVSPEWIDKCHEAGRFLGEKDYILNDEEGEKLYGMSLPQSIDRAQAKPLFKDMTVYSTANVRPEQSQMAEILDCAGGTLKTELPPKSSLKSLAEQKTEDGHPAFVCVTCEQDTHLCKDMKMAGIGVHNVEFVLSGILKQQLDFYRYKF